MCSAVQLCMHITHSKYCAHAALSLSFSKIPTYLSQLLFLLPLPPAFSQPLLLNQTQKRLVTESGELLRDGSSGAQQPPPASPATSTSTGCLHKSADVVIQVFLGGVGGGGSHSMLALFDVCGLARVSFRRVPGSHCYLRLRSGLLHSLSTRPHSQSLQVRGH